MTEAWAGRRFDRARWRMFGGVQLYRWLNLDGQYFFGDAVFYDPVDPYPGRSYEGGFGVNLQPSGRLSQAFNYRRISFDHALTGEHVYDIDLIYSRTTYQFSRQFFVRGIGAVQQLPLPCPHRFSSPRPELVRARSSMPGTGRSSSGADSSMENRSSAKVYSRRASAACSSRRRTFTASQSYPRGFAPSDSPTRSLARRFAGALRRVARSQRSLAPWKWSVRFMRQRLVFSCVVSGFSLASAGLFDGPPLKIRTLRVHEFEPYTATACG